ncbi:MAG: hypothetical protein OXJ55_11585 [Caldilineaceae bacterium]|nr:hypothetical protein [Caldilineaceae bacterium]MDE0500876.1 hypothetical protein [bacterium]
MNESAVLAGAFLLGVMVHMVYDLIKGWWVRRRVRRMMMAHIEASRVGAVLPHVLLLRAGQHQGRLDLVFQAEIMYQLARIQGGKPVSTNSLGISRKGMEEADRLMGSKRKREKKAEGEKDG